MRLRVGIFLLVSLASFGCISIKGIGNRDAEAVPAPLARSNDWIDLTAGNQMETPVDMEVYSKLLSRLKPDDSIQPVGGIGPEGRKLNCLALSGGGSLGAFTVGVLNGWTQTGNRPVFDVVTGVSTGSLIAPFAFLGPEFDEPARVMYTAIQTDNIYLPRSKLNIIFGESYADTAPLGRLIEKHLTPEFMAKIAIAHDQGRRLYVATTNLDARKTVIWDMGAIAKRADAGSLALFRKVLLASCSVPIFFPPVTIDVIIDGKHYTELHADGGVTTEVFIRFPDLADNPEAMRKRLIGSNVYAIVAGKLYADPTPTSRSLLGVAGSALTSFIYAQTRGDLVKIFTLCLVNGANFQLTSVPEDYDGSADALSFDPAEMNKLFTAGSDLARSGKVWRSLPPGTGRSEQVIPRTGPVFQTK
jgi:hypothetical protein